MDWKWSIQAVPELLLEEESEESESESLEESEEEESDEEEDDEEVEEESDDSTSWFWVMIILGAFFKCSLNSSLRERESERENNINYYK